MKPFRAYCRLCKQNHKLMLNPDEFKLIVRMPDSIDNEGYLNFPCESCSNQWMSVKQRMETYSEVFEKGNKP